MTNVKPRLIGALTAAGLAISVLPFQALTATADDDLPEGCVLSEYIPVWGDGIVAEEDAFASSEGGDYTSNRDPEDDDFFLYGWSQTISNLTDRDFYDARLAQGHHLLANVDDDMNRVLTPMDHIGDARFQAIQMPPGDPTRTGENPIVESIPVADEDFALTTFDEMNAPTNKITIAGVELDVAWDANVGSYVIGNIPAGGSAPVSDTIRIDSPAGGGSRYGLYTSELVSAKVCAPNPTIESWVDTDGSRKITGTGSLAGDEIVVTDAAGNVIGTTVVGDDLTWSITPEAAFAIGKYALTVTQYDQTFELIGTSAGDIEVIDPTKPTTKPTESSSARPGLPKTGS